MLVNMHRPKGDRKNSKLALLRLLADMARMNRRSLALLALVVFAGCPSDKDKVDAGPPDAGPKEVAEKEPNDRPDQAMTLAESSIVSGNLGADPAKPDEDWYLLSSATPKVVDLTLSGIPGGDVVIELDDVDRNKLALVNSEGEGKPERFPNLTVHGKIFVKVTSAKKGAGGAYTLTAMFSDPIAGFEA